MSVYVFGCVWMCLDVFGCVFLWEEAKEKGC